MTLAVRLALLFVLGMLLVGLVAGTVTATRHLERDLTALQLRSAAYIHDNAGLQYAIYSADKKALQRHLQFLIDDINITLAQAFSGPGEQLTAVGATGTSGLEPAPFAMVRRNMRTLDGGLQFFDHDSGAPLPINLWRALRNAQEPVYQTLPVPTLVNTGVTNLQPADFTRPLRAADNSSQRVVGYIHTLSDPKELSARATAAGMTVVAVFCTIAALGGAITWWAARRVTLPLRRLATLADAVAAGEVDEPLKVAGGPELEDITRLFNGVIEGMRDSRKVHEIDSRLLRLKVKERSSQLSERSEALDKAVKEADATRERLEKLANYDNLTKLPNRHLFTEQLELLLKLNQRHGHTLALLFIDLDEFKRVNESLGMGAGDKLLLEVSRRLSNALRDSDSVSRLNDNTTGIDVARLGGDEFTVILNQLDAPESAALVANRLIETLAAPLEVAGHQLSLHPSIGIAIAPTDGKDVESLLKSAGTAKYHAAQDGSETRYRFYRSNMGQQGAERLRLESDLRDALADDSLLLVYQPQIDTNSGSVIGAEALLRWQHAELGPVPPAKFVALAEKAGLMEQLGDWVLNKACEQVRAFNDEGVKLGKVAINVSSQQFSPAFVARVGAAVQAAGIDASQLELGLTEAIMSSNDPETVDALQALRASGVYLSVDDFGTGYSPLHYLSQYPLDELKIDRSFLLEAGRSPTGAKLVEAIISMAGSLGLRALATGVETESQFHFLTRSGVTLIQGYLFSKPVTAQALKPMLAPWHFVDQVQELAAGAED